MAIAAKSHPGTHFQNVLSEASEDELWLPRWLMADICPGEY